MAALSLLAFFGSGARPASADDELDAALRRKQQLENAVEASRATVERYRAIAGTYQTAVSAADQRIADLALEATSAQSEAEQLGFEIKISQEQLQLVSFQLDETRALVDSLDAQTKELDRQLDRREALYADHLRAAYRQSQVTPLEMLLSSASLAEFATRVQSLVLLQRQDAQLASDIRGLREGATLKKDDLTGKQLEIGGLQTQVTLQRDRLSLEKARYDQMVADAQSAASQQAVVRQGAQQLRNNATSAAQAEAAQAAQLNKQLEAAEAAYEDLAAREAARSGLGAFNGAKVAIWPLRGPLTSGYGPRWGGFHNGVDIAAPMFTPVRAASSGIVTTVGRPYVASGDTAVVVIIAHGSNFSTLYGHLDDVRWPTVSVGQRVNAGDVVGFVGMTGWTTGPHLHFMTIANGRAVNPIPYLP